MFETETRSQTRSSAELPRLSCVLPQVQDRVRRSQATAGSVSAGVVARQLTIGRVLPQMTGAKLQHVSAEERAERGQQCGVRERHH